MKKIPTQGIKIVKFILPLRLIDFKGREWFFTPIKRGGKMLKNLKIVLMAVALTGTTAYGYTTEDYYKISEKEVRLVEVDVLNVETHEILSYQRYAQDDGGYQVDPVEKVGKVISVARDLVALGEDIYQLVIKGKPTNKTSYAPISVVPRVNGTDVYALDIAYSKEPVKRTYEVVYKNVYGMEVVKFRYSVMYSYGGSYEGRGAYLLGVQVTPDSVNTLFGYDFTATMKLGGIQNIGSKEDPIAGATVLIEYTVSTILKANNEVDSYFIGGNGRFKQI